MSFSPVVPFGGYAGWTFLKRTLDAQQVAFSAAPERKRDEAYFREKIGQVRTADDLVSDRRLLKVALGAYGLDADINNTFFIRKVLQDGTLSDTALSNRLADKQYRAFSAAFGFGDFATPNTVMSDFADKVLTAYQTRQFDRAVGDRNPTMRLALNAEREVAALARQTLSDDAKWFTVMGSAPLREVFRTALGLPRQFASVDIDQQLGVLKDRADRLLGAESFSAFAEPGAVDGLVRRFLALSTDDAGGSQLVRGSGALDLLQTGGRSSGNGILALLA